MLNYKEEIKISIIIVAVILVLVFLLGKFIQNNTTISAIIGIILLSALILLIWKIIKENL